MHAHMGRQTSWGLVVGIASVLTVGAVAPDVARAQSMPGLIVTVPPDESSSSPAPSRPAPRQNSVGVPGIASTQPTWGGRPPQANPEKRAPAKKKSTRRRTPKKSHKRHASPSRRSGTSIVVLVNDDPITEYEVTQRARLMSFSADIRNAAQSAFKRLIKRPSTNARLKQILQQTVEENRGKSREQILSIFERRKKAFAVSLQKQAVASARSGALSSYRKKAIEELIEERLKLLEAKRLKMAPSKKELDQAIAEIAKRNKTDVKGFVGRMSKMGVDFMTMRERIRSQIAWGRVVRSRFARLISINQRDIDQELASQTDNSSTIKMHLQRITLSLPEKVTQSNIAQRIAQAEAMQRRFKDCKSSKTLARSVSGAKFEDLGTRQVDSIPEPTRTLLINAQDGQMVPPSTTVRGVETYAVCSRSVTRDTMQDRAKARAMLQQKEFDILARRHLMDLKRDGHIEYR